MTTHISSTQNKLIKEVILCKEKSRHRKRAGRFVIEGWNELNRAVANGYDIDTVFIQPEILQNDQGSNNLDALNADIVSVSDAVYQRIAYRSSTQGIVALACSKSLALNDLKLKNECPLILVAEGIEKPGNIGALLRTADAAGVDAVIMADPKADFYNPNTIRSSVGCIFTVPIAQDSSEAVFTFLKKHKVNIYAAALGDSTDYYQAELTRASAIVVGTEATGLTPFWLEQADGRIKIPMHGDIDSLNVSVSAAILIFEAIRQRSMTL